MAERTRRVVLDVLAAWNAHDVERLASYYAPHYHGIDVGQARVQHGRHDLARSATALLAALPDVQFEGETIVEGERAVLIWLMRGTHRAPLMRIPPTNRFVEVRGSSILTIDSACAHQIVHGLYIWDVAGFLRSVGLLPEL
jgi:predicted ester cyclase